MPRIIYFAFMGWEPTKAEDDVISQAMSYWEEELDGEIFFSRRSPDDLQGSDLGFFRATQEEIGTPGDWAAHWMDENNELVEDIGLGPIWFKPRMFQRARQENLIRHELGHYLGYDHSRNPLSVMHPSSTNLPWRASL